MRYISRLGLVPTEDSSSEEDIEADAVCTQSERTNATIFTTWGLDGDFNQQVKAEAMLLLLAPWASLLVAVTVASFIGRVPSALYLMALPLLVRAIHREVCFLREQGKTLGEASMSSLILDFLFSKLEVVDGVADGLAIATAFFLDQEAYDRFLASFQGISAILLPVLRLTRGLGGLSLLTMFFASYVQISTLSSSNAAVPADLAGFGLLAKHLDDVVGGAHDRMRLMGLSRVLAESAPQMLIQTSLLMARGKDIFNQRTVLISVLLTFAGTSKRAVMFIKAVLAVDRRPVDVIGAICVSLLLVLIVFRLYFMEICGSGIWGLTTGCVVQP